MNWVEGMVSIAVVIGICVIADAICTTVRYGLGERPRRWTGGGYPLPPGRNPPPPGYRPDPPPSPPPPPGAG